MTGYRPNESYRQTVAGDENTWRVIGFDWLTSFTVYVNTPLFASLNEKLTTPTCVRPTRDASHRAALNAGPVVRYSAPA
jgi:hypothetical protein